MSSNEWPEERLLAADRTNLRVPVVKLLTAEVRRLQGLVKGFEMSAQPIQAQIEKLQLRNYDLIEGLRRVVKALKEIEDANF